MIDEGSLRATIEFRAKVIQYFVAQAQNFIAGGNYSDAATALHRAHQHHLVIEALEFALNEPPERAMHS